MQPLPHQELGSFMSKQGTWGDHKKLDIQRKYGELLHSSPILNLYPRQSTQPCVILLRRIAIIIGNDVWHRHPRANRNI
jgi:hypothetical protein